MAYPAKQLAAKCHESRTSQLDKFYTCQNAAADSATQIDNFWSTSAVDPVLGQSVAHVMVDVLVLDDLGQPVSIGEVQKQSRSPLLPAP